MDWWPCWPLGGSSESKAKVNAGVPRFGYRQTPGLGPVSAQRAGKVAGIVWYSCDTADRLQSPNGGITETFDPGGVAFMKSNSA